MVLRMTFCRDRWTCGPVVENSTFVQASKEKVAKIHTDHKVLII